jgi:hypothetical protein
MIKKARYAILLVAVVIVGAMLPMVVKAQANIEVFGQNRVQTRKFAWKFFDTKHFRVYHYDKAGRDLGRYVAEEAENSIKIIEKKLGGQFPQRFNIILYNSYDEYRQSNVGLKDEGQAVGNTKAGTLNLVGDKLVVYFTGEHNELRRQIRSGMARVVMCRLIFGENFKKMVKNALLLNLPQWVTDGYISYLVDGWDAKTNSAWKGLTESQPNTGFYELAEQYPELAGKAFWKFVSERYGNHMVKNLLYAMQQKASLNKAMKDKENLGVKVTKAFDSCLTFYREVYAKDASRQEMPDSAHGLISLKVPKDNSVLRNIRVSPMGSDVSYVAWKDGQYTVYTQKTAGAQQLSAILEGGQKDLTEQIDPNYPMMAWSNTGNKLAILYKKGSRTYLRIYNSQRGRIENFMIPPNRFERVMGLAFTQDDDKLVFSAIKKSQSDLYLFTFKGSKMTNITDDQWDDISPEFISGGSRTGILFLSNRTKPNINVPLGVNELPTGPMNVFFYNIKTMRPELLQCTNVTKGHITQPIQYGLDNFAYLYDSNGVNNKFVVLFERDRNNRDSAYSVPITNYATSIISHQYNPASGDVADVVQEKDKYRVYFHDLQMPGQNTEVKKLTPTTLSHERPDIKPLPPDAGVINVPVVEPEVEEEPEQPEIKSGNAFQTEFSDTAAAPKRKAKSKANKIFNPRATADSSILTEMTDSAYLKMKPSPYRISVKPDFFTIKLDNTILFSQYQAIATNGGQYDNQALGGLTTLSLNELLENHRLTAGFQIPIKLTEPTTTYFLQYSNFTRRLDWEVLFVRRAVSQQWDVTYVDTTNANQFTQPQTFKSVNTLVQGGISYPFDRMRSLRFRSGLRQDKLIEKTTDFFSLGIDLGSTNYSSMNRLEYVFDNTISPAINILNGSRYKVYAEYMVGLTDGNKQCYNIGFDFRNYKKLYKNFILATRVAYAHSDGNNAVEYLLGGVDNWLNNKTDPKANQPPAENIGFQMLATSLRGYKQYAFRGNNFGVFSTELRLPIFTTFVKRPVQSAILKNLQVVAFLDAGAGWRRFWPNADNLATTYNYPNNRIKSPASNRSLLSLTVPSNGGLGFGPGLRTSLFGYFVRLDVAWNMEGKGPFYYLALGNDF